MKGETGMKLLGQRKKQTCAGVGKTAENCVRRGGFGVRGKCVDIVQKKDVSHYRTSIKNDSFQEEPFYKKEKFRFYVQRRKM